MKCKRSEPATVDHEHRLIEAIVLIQSHKKMVIKASVGVTAVINLPFSQLYITGQVLGDPVCGEVQHSMD